MADNQKEQLDEYRSRLSEILKGLSDALCITPDLTDALTRPDVNILDGVDASGAAVASENEIRILGDAPSPDVVRAIIGEIPRLAEDQVWSTDHLSKHSPTAAAVRGAPCGLMAVRLRSSKRTVALWFRPEHRQTLPWAPHSSRAAAAAVDGHPRLMARSSFALWTQVVCGKAKPWLDSELSFASGVGRAVHEALLSRAAELNAELQRSNRELEDFTYAVSHDLKEPLRGVHIYAQLLERSAASRLREDELERLTAIMRLSRRMEDLIETLLEYSRVGQMELNRTNCSLRQIVDDVVENLKSTLDRAEIEVRVADLPAEFRCDAVLVREILQNLIANAAKYNDRQERWIEVGRQPGDPPVYYVRDNGIGVAQRHYETIFQIFRRLHPPERFGGGSGAGLTIARRAAERHGGRMWVESELGVGTTFYFTLGPGG